MKLDAAPWSGQAAAQGGKAGRVDRHRAVDGLQLRRLLHAHPRTRRRRARAFELGPGRPSGCCSTPSPPGATPVSMREQVQVHVPYARFQSAMFDRDTLIIATTRSAASRAARALRKAIRPAARRLRRPTGLCVQVCPTGIDIRKGLQYECIGAPACIDACDAMMAKIGQPAGTVRYDTLNGMEQGLTAAQRLRRALRPRVLVYGVVLLAITLGGGEHRAALALQRSTWCATAARWRASSTTAGWRTSTARGDERHRSPQRYVARRGGITIASAPPLPAQARWWWWRCACRRRPGAAANAHRLPRRPAGRERAPGASWRRSRPSSFPLSGGPGSSIPADAHQRVARGGRIPVAVGAARVQRPGVPGAAAAYLHRALGRAGRIVFAASVRSSARRASRPSIPDVAVHVEEAEGIGREAAHRRSEGKKPSCVGSARPPTAASAASASKTLATRARKRVVAAVVLAVRAGAAGVFPFGLGGQPVVPAFHAAQPARQGLGVVPGHVDDRVLVALREAGVAPG